MKISLFQMSLDAGGAERVSVELAEHWISQGHEVSIITITGDDRPPRYPLDKRIRHIRLDKMGNSRNIAMGVFRNFGRIVALRSALRDIRPDVVVAQLTREITVATLATRGLAIPVIGHFHSDPNDIDHRFLWRLLHRWSFKKADQMVFLTDETLERFPESVRSRARAIVNPLRPPSNRKSKLPERFPRPNITCIAAFRPVKDHKNLVDAFSLLAASFPEWHLVLVGEGETLEETQRHVATKNLENRIHLPGFVPNHEAVLAQADIFALPSRWEGFSMALCEAMAAGLPVVTTDSSDGQRLIVRDGIDGLLVPVGDPIALAEAFRRLMSDDDLRERMGSCAREVLERFQPESVFAEWDTLLATVTGDPDRTMGRRDEAMTGQLEA